MEPPHREDKGASRILYVNLNYQTVEEEEEEEWQEKEEGGGGRGGKKQAKHLRISRKWKTEVEKMIMKEEGKIKA